MTNTEQWNPTQRRKTIPRARIERWLGKEKADRLSSHMIGPTKVDRWYGPPINVRDLPGSVWIDGNGEYVGDFQRGEYFSADDAFELALRKVRGFRSVWDRALGQDALPLYAGAGFASLSDALSRASQGYRTYLHNGPIAKNGPTGVVSSGNSLWRVGPQPAVGTVGSAAPGGLACVSTTTGAMTFTNPSSGTLHLTGADFSASVISNAVMLYDRLFQVAKTIASTANESVTGVPTRYQSSTTTAADYAGGSFLQMQVTATSYANTAHNWGVAGSSNECLYRNQAGTDNSILPVLAGNPGATATIADRFDMPINTWFAPLASGDTGVMDLAQMRCSASVATGSLDFVIGHPIGIMAFPIIGIPLPFDWLTNRELAPRIFDNACLALFEFPKPTTTATTYNGILYATNAAP
jgi:hypothetical protein